MKIAENISDEESLEVTVAFDINGQKISLKEYTERNERAEASYTEGKYNTSEQLKNKFRFM